MCDVCLTSPCVSRCPNAPEPEAIYTCKYCGEPIAEGEEYVEIEGNYYHLDDCIYDCAVSILLEKCGASKGIAERYGY